MWGDSMFKVGDKIVYPMHGAGKIKSIEEINLLGDLINYYVVEIDYKSIEVKIPVEKAEELKVRSLSNLKELEEEFEKVKGKEFESFLNWNTRYRINIEKIKNGTIEDMVDVISMLESLDKEKGLSTGEKQLLNNAKEILASEVVMIEGISFDKALEIVNKFIV